MKILVCGGRDFDDYASVDKILSRLNPKEICHGGARGADFLAGKWAKDNDTPCTVFRADWQKYGKAAGPIRNKKMLTEYNPDIVVAFPGGSGTANMISIAKEAKVPVMEVTSTIPKIKYIPYYGDED